MTRSAANPKSLQGSVSRFFEYGLTTALSLFFFVLVGSVVFTEAGYVALCFVGGIATGILPGFVRKGARYGLLIALTLVSMKVLAFLTQADHMIPVHRSDMIAGSVWFAVAFACGRVSR